jgi:hypothetical protein
MGTLWDPKKPKNSFPLNPKEALLSINLHSHYMKILFKFVLVTIFTWANGKHGEYGCTFVL